MPRKDDGAALLQGFGRAVRQRRKTLGLSQEKLGFRASLDATYVSGIERGIRNPTLRTMGRLSKALDTRVSKLIVAAEED